MPSCIPIKKL